MPTQPSKRTGFSQGIYQQSATKKEDIGTLRVLKDGRKFRYARAGAANLSHGKANCAALIAAGVTNQACASAHAIGDTVITETITAGVAYAEDFFKGGMFQVNDATGEGYQYEIVYSSAVTAAGTSITLALDRPIVVALVAATSEFTIVHNPEMNVVETTAEENLFTGVAPIDVTATYYFWNQTGGDCCYLSEATSAYGVGTVLTLSATSGALQAIVTALDIDVAYQVGVARHAGADGEYKSGFLTWD